MFSITMLSHTFYQCVQMAGTVKPNMLYCEPVEYKDIGTPKVVKGEWVYTRLTWVPFYVPKILHPIYLSFTLMPPVSVLPKN
jgi:hypothetical protein